jgi:arabinan endo-1,5-alpha-L-arabinosidase
MRAMDDDLHGRRANLWAPDLSFRNGQYYLYYSAAGVAMTSGGGTQILAAHGSIHGPGHQAVLNDNGTEFLFYHYYADSGASFLGINRLGWDAGGRPFVF